MLPILHIRDVAERQLCCGCGACAAAAPGDVRMVDDHRFGRRPIIDADTAAARAAIDACPGAALEHTFDMTDPGLIRSLLSAWGPVYGVWEGYAADDEIRLAGSSGGAASALALYAIESGGMHGALHAAARSDRPYLNETVLSVTRDELLARTGSRYAPASPCDGLSMIEDAPGPCVFIGKPCDVAGAAKTRRLRPALDAKLGLTIAFFCAGAPSTNGTLALLRTVGVDDPDTITSLRYRGNGWPGRWTVKWRDASGEPREASLSYEESWGFLQAHRQWRCYICPDHTGEFADIAVGDPWYRSIEDGEPGRSLIVVRTERGREILHKAAAAGYIILETKDASLLPRSQPNLLQTRGGLWGRLVALRLFGAATPKYVGFPMCGVWLRGLTVKQKAQSIIGTMKRIGRKRLRHRVKVIEDGRDGGAAV